MKLRKGGMFFEHYNYFGCLIVVLCYGLIYLIVQILKIDNDDWFYAIPPVLVFLYSLFNDNENLYYFPFNRENDENSESD